MAGQTAQLPTKGRIRADAQARKLRFVEAYLSNGRNITQAALTTGFAPKAAAQQGSRLFKSADVQALIEQRERELLEVVRTQTNLTVERILLSLARAVEFDISKLVKEDGTPKLPHELDEDTRLAVSAVEFELGKDGKATAVKYKGPNRDQARDQALKHLGLFKEDHQQGMQPLADAMLKVAGIGPLKEAFAKRLAAGGAAT